MLAGALKGEGPGLRGLPLGPAVLAPSRPAGHLLSCSLAGPGHLALLPNGACVQVSFSRSVGSDSVTPRTAARQASLSITSSRSSLTLMFIASGMPSSHLILCRLLLLLPSIFPSFRVFFNESALHIRWPENWSFNISPFNEYSGLISFRMDWFDLPVVQRTLNSLLQHHSSKASILQC